MQFEISDLAALVFSQSLYQAITDGLPVDVAVVEARRGMWAGGGEVEWATPVLYLRAPDGQVFTVDRLAQAERQAREQAERQRVPHVPQPCILQLGKKVWAVAFSPDGTRLATSSGRHVRVWNLQTEATIWKKQFGRLGSHPGGQLAREPDRDKTPGSEDSQVTDRSEWSRTASRVPTDL